MSSVESVSIDLCQKKKEIKYEEYPPNYHIKPEQSFFYIEKVKDWQDRIKDYSAHVKSLYQQAFEKRKDLLKIFNEGYCQNGWSKSYEKGTFVLEERVSESGNTCIRAT